VRVGGAEPHRDGLQLRAPDLKETAAAQAGGRPAEPAPASARQPATPRGGPGPRPALASRRRPRGAGPRPGARQPGDRPREAGPPASASPAGGAGLTGGRACPRARPRGAAGRRCASARSRWVGPGGRGPARAGGIGPDRQPPTSPSWRGPDATFAFSEVRIGVIPGRDLRRPCLPRLTGPGRRPSCSSPGANLRRGTRGAGSALGQRRGTGRWSWTQPSTGTSARPALRGGAGWPSPVPKFAAQGTRLPLRDGSGPAEPSCRSVYFSPPTEGRERYSGVPGKARSGVIA